MVLSLLWLIFIYLYFRLCAFKESSCCLLYNRQEDKRWGRPRHGPLPAITHNAFFCLFIQFWFLFFEFTEKDSISFRFAWGFDLWMIPTHPMIPATVSRMLPWYHSMYRLFTICLVHFLVITPNHHPFLVSKHFDLLI
jgi:hypothetical protein